MPPPKVTPKAEETGIRILGAALALFRQEGFDQPRLLRFRVTENPAPMQEWSPYALIRAEHLHGYLISKRPFRLTPLGNGHILLGGTTRYRDGCGRRKY